MRSLDRSLVVAVLGSALAGCSTPTEPTHSDVGRARIAWLATQATSYTFEVAIETSWVPKSGYYRVEVRDKVVIAAREENGNPAPGFSLTIDEIWDRLLDARERGELNSALFGRHGVPVEADMGPWPVDGGVRYSVRRFVKTA
jgi:hypothetical protein